MANLKILFILFISSVNVLFGNCADEALTNAYEDFIDGRHCLAVPVGREVPGYVMMQGEVEIDGVAMHYYCEKTPSRKEEL